jgi:hypothetical protein
MSYRIDRIAGQVMPVNSFLVHGHDGLVVVEFLTYLFSDVVGNNASVTDTVERVLDRPPRDFTDYATRTAATGIWTPPPDR